VTSRLEAQCPNQLCHRVPQQVQEGRLNIKNKQNVQIQYLIKLITFRYTGCPRRKGPNFGRVFLRSNYTDVTQNTYIQSSMITEILNIEK